MTIQHLTDDAHHDLTWCAGALARALFARAEAHEAVLPALEKLAACDFSAPLKQVRPALARPCRWLPEALTAALAHAEELTMALAASLEHLHWRAPEAERGEDWAVASLLGPQGPLASAEGGVEVLVAGPGVTARCERDRTLLFVLAGEARVRDEHGALRHVDAGAVAVSVAPASPNGAAQAIVEAVGRAPLLAMLLAVGDASGDSLFSRAIHG